MIPEGLKKEVQERMKELQEDKEFMAKLDKETMRFKGRRGFQMYSKLAEKKSREEVKK